jgi:hypothetical protein
MGRYQKNVRFEWNLAQVPRDLPPLPPKHEIKIQLQPDTELTWEGIQRSFLNEKAWMIGLEAHLDQLRRRIFPEGKPLEKMDFLFCNMDLEWWAVARCWLWRVRARNYFRESSWIMSISEEV